MNALARLLDGIFMWAWNTSLAATVLIALVLVAQIVLRRFLSARWLYALWFCVLLRLLLPIAPPSSFSVFNLGSQLLPQEHNAWAPARIPLSAPSDSPIPKFGQSHSRSAANSTTGDLNAEAAVAFSLSPGERAGV